jgi:tRNAThr (cytosine32-N3)-methyltransferase
MKILCVCTGNTCRSPMLAALLRAELPRTHPHIQLTVESAGTGADDGKPASPEAVACMAELGLDLSAHRSRHVDALDLASFDRVLCMTSGHAAYVRSRGVPAASLEVVNAYGGGVPDPFGGSPRDYAACAQVLARFAREFTISAVADLQHPQLPEWLKAINQVHRQDPERVDGQPAELIYAMHLERWIGELVPAPSAALLLAARCQHLERWAIARSEFAADKAGYFAWRKAVHQHQGKRATALLSAAGCPEALTTRVAQLVAKAAPKADPEGQALEDAACLVFLEIELAGFAAEHPDYTRDKFIDIIRKTWRKMSPDGHRLALTIPLPAALAELVKAALTP